MRFTAPRLDASCFSIPAGAQTMNDLMNASSRGLLVEQPLQAFWTTYDPRDLASGSVDPLGFVRGYAPPNRLIPYTRMALSRVDGAHRRTHLNRLHRLPYRTEFSLNATSVLN
jgi:hypothetical protein